MTILAKNRGTVRSGSANADYYGFGIALKPTRNVIVQSVDFEIVNSISSPINSKVIIYRIGNPPHIAVATSLSSGVPGVYNGYLTYEFEQPVELIQGVTYLIALASTSAQQVSLVTYEQPTFTSEYSNLVESIQGETSYIGTYWMATNMLSVRASALVSVNMIINGTINNKPVINAYSPTANVTLHENSTLTLAGNTTDTDVDDVVTVKYQIDSGAVRNLHSAVSDGATPINFSKALTYKDGMLYDGATVITSKLDKDTPHTVSTWAEDGKGGKSTIVTRTFFIVPNRPPSITVNPIAAQSDLINSNVINISGAVTDLDNNDVTVTFKINDGEEQQVYQGPPSAFTFNILLNDLKVGANTVIVKGTDIYNTAGTKTLTINKTHNATAVNTAVARYQIQAPTGSAKSILLWVTRTLGNLGITAEVSLTNGNDAENYVALNETNSAIVNGLREEEFAYQGTVDKEKIILKITYDRTDAAVIDTIKQVSGVLF